MENCAYLRKNPGYAPENETVMTDQTKVYTEVTIQ